MSGSQTRPTARVVSQEEIPQPPPTRRRRASILVQTIGDLSAREVVVDDEELVANVGIVRIIGGANGQDDDRVAHPGTTATGRR